MLAHHSISNTEVDYRLLAVCFTILCMCLQTSTIAVGAIC